MPVGWRVKTAFYNKPELETRRYEFISTDARDIALRKLTASVRTPVFATSISGT